MTTHSNPRPMTDYKKTVLVMKSIKQYEELSDTLMKLLDELRDHSLADDEIKKLNIALSDLAREMEELVSRITQYGGKV